ncbi:MAG: S1C family serine protease [Rhodoferax sp.]
MNSISRPILTLCLAWFSFVAPCRAAMGAEQETFVERLRQVVVGIVVTEAERAPDPQLDTLAARFGISRTAGEQSNVLAARKPGTRRFAGSGMVVSADGLVLTTDSLFQRHQSIEIHTEAGAEYAGTLVLRDRISGLALIKIQSPLVWGHLRIEKPAQSISVGERVLAFGLAWQGEKWQSTVTQGVIAELERSDVPEETAFKSSAPMAGGQLEGGPLVGASSGEVIGINLSEWNWGPDKGKTQASPIENYLKIRTDLQSHGRVIRPYIGLAMGRLRAEDKQALSSFDRAIKGGIVVFGTTANGPAHLAGIERGDIVVRLNAIDVLSVSGFNRTLHGLNPGDQIVLTVLRKGALLPIEVKARD